jgi:hypothetical protein
LEDLGGLAKPGRSPKLGGPRRTSEKLGRPAKNLGEPSKFGGPRRTSPVKTDSESKFILIGSK